MGNLAPVSVIIPCYNSSETIQRTLESAFSQTRLPQEVIAVDDASTDDTLKILRRFQSEYGKKRLRVLSLNQNGGPGRARNLGWNAAQAPYIAFLDADDTWHPKKIEIQSRWMADHPEVAMSGHPCLHWKQPDRAAGQEPPPLPSNWQCREIQAANLLLFNCFPTPSVMLRRDLPFRFDPDRRYSEDYRLWLQVVASGYQAWLLDLPLAYWHKPPHGHSGLSGDLWQMERAELQNYADLRRSRAISWPVFLGVSSFSLLKYCRRVMMQRMRAYGSAG